MKQVLSQSQTCLENSFSQNSFSVLARNGESFPSNAFQGRCKTHSGHPSYYVELTTLSNHAPWEGLLRGRVSRTAEFRVAVAEACCREMEDHILSKELFVKMVAEVWKVVGFETRILRQSEGGWERYQRVARSATLIDLLKDLLTLSPTIVPREQHKG